MKKGLAILGAGGFAREVFWHYRDFALANGTDHVDLVFVDDVTGTNQVSFSNRKETGAPEFLTRNSYAVIADWKFSPDCKYEFLVGIGSPQAKEKMVAKALHSGLRAAPTLIHPRALIQDAVIGHGGVITPGVVITTQVTVGHYVILNLNSTVGHDCIIEDYCTINPGCAISGNTNLRKSATLGTGTVTREKIEVAAGVVSGAQSAIVSPITEENVTVVGVPAKRIVR